jgi:FkbM family methyltransferase
MLSFGLPARLRRLIKPLVPPPVWRGARRWTARLIGDFLDPYRRTSYSQEGEDLILDRALRQKPRGYYVDVGAFHPKKFSNTYLFYRRGWTGINIDATPESMGEFRRVRPRDTNLVAAISDQEAELTFNKYSNPLYNGIGRRIRDREVPGLNHLGTESVRSLRLRHVFERYLPESQPIDFLSVDVEGHEINVLRSNDWARFRPTYLCVEERGASLTSAPESEVVQFLNECGYELFAKTFQTLIFRDTRSRW